MPVSGTEARRYFDRLLVAQAIEEGRGPLTRDTVLPRYSDLVLPV